MRRELGAQLEELRESIEDRKQQVRDRMDRDLEDLKGLEEKTLLTETRYRELSETLEDIAMAAARQGVNVVGISMTVAGGTSPVTLAGTLVQSNAEILSLLVLNQLAGKGAPYTYSQTSIMMDLKTGLGALGAPETGLINAASAQLAQYYRLPCWIGGGGYNDSKIVDAQAILEEARYKPRTR